MLHADERPLSEKGHSRAFVPDREWWERLFATIDAADAVGFIEFLTPDAQFRFGNAPVLTGSQAIAAALVEFFATISSSRHLLHEFWATERSVGCEGDVRYARLDGSVVSFPFANIFRLRGADIASYHIYIDNSALYAPIA
jgi:ketosteroid isomerase-like protein